MKNKKIIRLIWIEVMNICRKLQLAALLWMSIYQLLSGTGWFSYKIWTNNSKTPMVNLVKNLRPFQNYNFKIRLEINFLTFLDIDWNSFKKIRIEIWTFSFQICFPNKFWSSGSGQTENTQIRVFAYFCLTTSGSPKSILTADLKWECPYFYSRFFLEIIRQTY